MSLSHGMFSSPEAAIDKQKNDWDKRLDTLLEKFNALKPDSDNKKLMAEWNRLEYDADTARISILHYTQRSPDAYRSITSTLNQLNTYIKQRQRAIQATADKDRGDRVFARIMQEPQNTTEENKTKLAITKNPA